MRHHLDWKCVKRRAACELKCSAFIVAELMPQHVAEVCPHRPMPCRWCRDKVMAKDLKAHVKQCPARQNLCRHGCGEYVANDNLVQHDEICSYVHVACPLKCGNGVRRGELSMHMESLCSDRLVICPRGCLHEDVNQEDKPPEKRMYGPVLVMAKVLHLHDKYECTRRPQICKLCAEMIEVADMSNHLSYHCTHRPVDCRNKGCLKTLPLCKREDHEKLRCRFRIVLCRQGCGEKSVAIDLVRHMNKHCIMRRVQCPLGCGEEMKFMNCDAHLNNDCIRRGSPSKSKMKNIDGNNKKKS